MAAMALGGILFSLLDPARRHRRRHRKLSPAPSTTPTSLAPCAAAALLTLLPLNLPAAIAIALLIGAGLGTLTVTLVTHLRTYTGPTNPLLKVGLGTGLGYLLCNFPPLFTAPPQLKPPPPRSSALAAFFDRLNRSAIPATAPVTLQRSRAATPAVVCRQTPGQRTFPLTLLAFTALIWLDSAAFFIIQTTPTLKASTWQGTTHLYLNGTLHLAAALLSVYLLRRRGLTTTLSFALLALATACLLLSNPQEATHRALLASLFYPIGVSLYSVALVAYPAFLSPAATLAQRARQAGLLYAIGGWFGSAMGIGMGQNLGHIPPLFVLSPPPSSFSRAPPTRRRELLATTAHLLAALPAPSALKALTPTPTPLTQIQRGRKVYIAEGCINCHSQYIRPNTPDVLLWGPVQTLADLRAERPPLIGNRRQGPDLSNVALRRSPALAPRPLLIDPCAMSHDSIMPTFAYLFRESSAAPSRERHPRRRPHRLSRNPPPHRRRCRRSTAPPNSPGNPTSSDSLPPISHGQQLYTQECATCHNPNGATRNQWRTSFHRLPTNLTTGPYCDSATADPATRIHLPRSSSSAFPTPTWPAMNISPTPTSPPSPSTSSNSSPNPSPPPPTSPHGDTR